jgi:hypothetical protein
MVHDELGGAVGVLERIEGDDLALPLGEEPAGEGDGCASEVGGELATGVGTSRKGFGGGVEKSCETEHDGRDLRLRFGQLRVEGALC